MANIIGHFEPKYVQPKVVEAPRMTFQTFYKKYIEPGNSAIGGVKYEYCNGFVEQTTTMNPKKLFLVQHLTDLFYRMKQETGVRVLWIIYPQLRVVHVYTSTKRITVCEDDTDICSAAPVLPEFEISIYDLFKI